MTPGNLYAAAPCVVSKIYTAFAVCGVSLCLAGLFLGLHDGRIFFARQHLSHFFFSIAPLLLTPPSVHVLVALRALLGDLQQVLLEVKFRAVDIGSGCPRVSFADKTPKCASMFPFHSLRCYNNPAGERRRDAMLHSLSDHAYHRLLLP